MRQLIRALAILTLLIGVFVTPLNPAYACSCATPGAPADVIATAEVAFLGSVVATAPGGGDPNGLGPMVRYAFAVERASVPTDGVLEVEAIGGDGGASCGFTFSEGERWFVAAYGDGGTLQTNLCSGNVLVETMAAGELERVRQLLPEAPVAVSDPAAEGTGLTGSFLPVAVAILSVVALGGLMVLAFGRSGARSG